MPIPISRVQPLEAACAPPNDERSHQNGDVRERITQIVNPNRAHVQVAAPARHRQRDAAVYGQRKQRDPQHQAGLHLPPDGRRRMTDSPISTSAASVKDDGVHERGENSRAMIAECFLRCGRAQRPAYGQPGDDQRGDVGEIVNRVADEGDRFTGVPGGELHDDQEQRGQDGCGQDAGGRSAPRPMPWLWPPLFSHMVCMAVRIQVHPQILLAEWLRRTVAAPGRCPECNRRDHEPNAGTRMHGA